MNTKNRIIDGRKTVSTSEVSNELCINVDVQLLTELGYAPAFEAGVGTYWFADEIAGMALTLSECLESIVGSLEEKHGLPPYLKESIDG